MNEAEVEEILAEPKEPSWVSSISGGLSILQQNAWFIVAGTALLYYLWKEKLAGKYYMWIEKRKSTNLSAKIKKENIVNYEESRMNTITRLQEEYNKQASKTKEFEKAKEEKKREQLISKTRLQGARKLNDSYFPLSGQSSFGYMRPPRRSGCPGGC